MNFEMKARPLTLTLPPWTTKGGGDRKEVRLIVALILFSTAQKVFCSIDLFRSMLADMQRAYAFWIASITLLPSLCFSQTRPASQPGTRFSIGSVTTAPAHSMSRETLEPVYRRELGTNYNPAFTDRYYEIHKLLEMYFTADSAEDRKALTKWISSYGVDANQVGRLARIRMDWPALEPGTYTVNDRVGPHEVHYFLGIPKGYDRSVPWPLVIMLPTATAFLTDPKPDADGVARLYTEWITDELARHPDAVVLMPLLNLSEGWGPSYPGMNSVIQAMFHATHRVNIDPARVDLIGYDMSAHAVWNLGLHYTTYFAALNPFAGSASQDWQRTRLMNLRNTYVVTWHDVDDQAVKVNFTRALTDVLHRFKYDLDYEETHNIGHTPTAEIIQRTYEKVRSRVRDLYPKQVSLQSNRPDTMFNRLDWLQMYQALRPGPDRKLLFRHGGGSMVVNQNGMTLQATIANNRIDAKTDNVESMRFYLNDRMIDFARPVVLSINGRVKFDGLLKPNLDEMLKDQLFLGRGWRYYSAVIDVDFGEPSTKPSTKPK